MSRAFVLAQRPAVRLALKIMNGRVVQPVARSSPGRPTPQGDDALPTRLTPLQALVLTVVDSPMPLEAVRANVSAPALVVEEAVQGLVCAGLLCWSEATVRSDTQERASPVSKSSARPRSPTPGGPSPASLQREEARRRSPESDLADLLKKAKAMVPRAASMPSRSPATAVSGRTGPAKQSKVPGGLNAQERAELAARFFRLEDDNHYQVLDLKPDATRAEIRAAYFALSKRFHPDRLFHEGHEDLANQMAKLFARLTEAYDVLGRPARREAYDRRLGLLRDRKHTPAAAHRPLASREMPEASSQEPLERSTTVASTNRSRSLSPEQRSLQARQRAGARLRAVMGRATAPPASGPSVASMRGADATSDEETSASEAFAARKRLAVEAEARDDNVLALALWEALAIQSPNDTECAQACQRLKPKALETRMKILRAHVRRPDLDQASPEAALAWADLAEAAPDAETLRHVAGLVEQHRTLAVRLIPVFDAFALAHRKDIEAQHLLARVLLQAGLRARARRALEHAQRLEPANAFTKDLLKAAKS